MNKTGYIQALLGSFDTLGLFANLDGQMKSKWDENYFGVKQSSWTSIPMKNIRLKPLEWLSN